MKITLKDNIGVERDFVVVLIDEELHLISEDDGPILKINIAAVWGDDYTEENPTYNSNSYFVNVNLSKNRYVTKAYHDCYQVIK